MAPHDSFQDVPETFTVNVEAERNIEQLRQFSEYCRIFYMNSLSADQSTAIKKSDATHSSDLEGGVSDQQKDDIIETSKAVLLAFEGICAHRKSLSRESQTHSSAIAKCGLFDPEFLEGEQGTTRLGSYTKARDKERLNAHRHHILERKNTFLALLETKEKEYHESQSHSPSNNDKSIFQQWGKERAFTRTARNFSTNYKSKIGLHPFLAGLRKLFETQVQNKGRTVQWSFDIATLTENCSGESDLMLDSITLLTALLYRKINQEDLNDEKKDEFVDVSTVTWEIKDIISIRVMKRILQVLPRERDFDAKATGNAIISNEMRVESPSGSTLFDMICLDSSWCAVQ